MGTEAVLPESLHAPAAKRALVKAHVQELIATGVLRRGSRAPSILDLSRELDVAKNTVVAALDELCGEGVLEARERQGFFVRSAKKRGRVRETRLADLEADRVAHGMATILVQGGEDFVSIGGGTAAESLLATPAWTAALRNAPPRDPRTSLRYADPMGEPRLREVIAARYGGVDEAPERVIITHGAIEALNICFAATAALSGSRRIGIETPGYFMLGPMIAALGLEAVPIPRTREGIDLDRLHREIRRAPLAAMMVNPNHQNPIGSSLSLSQRFELAKLADERRMFLIEDDVYKGLWIEEEEPPTICSLDPQRTIYVSSFSKTLGPALRLGYILAPAPLVADLRQRKFLQTLSGDAYTQNLVADFVDRRGYQRHLVEMRDEIGRRARIARHQSEAFADLGRFAQIFSGGLFWRFDFAPKRDATALYRAARERNVLISPGCFFRADDEPDDGVRDAWMRVNVSLCEGTTLTRVLGILRAAARSD